MYKRRGQWVVAQLTEKTKIVLLLSFSDSSSMNCNFCTSTANCWAKVVRHHWTMQRCDRLSHRSQSISCCIVHKSSCLFSIQECERGSSLHHNHAMMMKVARASIGLLHESLGNFHSETLLLVSHNPSKITLEPLLFLFDVDEWSCCERIVVGCDSECAFNRCTSMECAYCIRTSTAYTIEA